MSEEKIYQGKKCPVHESCITLSEFGNGSVAGVQKTSRPLVSCEPAVTVIYGTSLVL